MITKLFALSVSFGTALIVLSKLLSFALKLLVSRLGVINFGDYYLVTATAVSITTLASLGIPMSLTRFIAFLRHRDSKQRTQRILSSSITLITLSATFAGFLLFVNARSIAGLIDAPLVESYIQILSFCLVGGALTNIVRAYYLGIVRIQQAYLTEAIDIVGKFTGVFLGIVWAKMGVVGAIMGYTTGALAASVINILRLLKHHRAPLITRGVSRELMGYAWPVGASEILTTITSTALIYLLRLKGGGEEVGYYAAAVSIASLIHLLPHMVLSVFLPIVSSRHASGKSIRIHYVTLMRWLVIITIPITLIVTLAGAGTTRLLFGATYTHASNIIPVLAIAYGLYAIFVWPTRQILDMAGFTKLNLVATMMRMIAIAATLTLFRFPLNGVHLAYAILMGWLVEGVCCIILVRYKRLLR